MITFTSFSTASTAASAHHHTDLEDYDMEDAGLDDDGFDEGSLSKFTCPGETLTSTHAFMR